MNKLFRVDTRPDGSFVVRGPGGDYLAVRDGRVADAVRHCCERAYRHGARDAATLDDTACTPAIVEHKPEPVRDEADVALSAMTSRQMGLGRAEAMRLLQRVRSAEPQLMAAPDLIRAMLLLRSPAPF